MVLSAHETRTKIVCTIGPSSRDPETIRALIREGMDVVRVNFSHGARAEHAETIKRVRCVAEEEVATVAVLADLQGPKLRVGGLTEPIDLKVGDWIALTTKPADGSHHVIPVPHPELIAGARSGGRWLFDDGAIEAIVREARPETVIAEVVVGGSLSSHKGVHVPGGTGRLSALTEKDREDATFSVSCGVDFVAQSFVQSADDVRVLRQFLDEQPNGGETAIVAKIEKREAIDDLNGILEVADAVMIARGDLGLEIPPQEVPLRQKEIIRQCNRRGLPVITATQMLQSMVGKPRPTRAESSDVANAILDGTDAVMLSAETAVGRYPVEAVTTIRQISGVVEDGMTIRTPSPVSDKQLIHPITDAIGDATARIADALNARLIATTTRTGYTARQIARKRPRRAIVAFTPRERVARQLSLVWGVTPLVVSDYRSTDELIDTVSKALVAREEAREGDLIVITGGIPAGGGGKTNFIKVHRV
ncbi:MAG: pyruvate kinase [Candidatus Bipolaricaulia bacterium]